MRVVKTNSDVCACADSWPGATSVENLGEHALIWHVISSASTAEDHSRDSGPICPPVTNHCVTAACLCVCVNVCVCPLVWSTGMSLRTNRAQKKKINKKQKSKKRREISMEVFADVVFYQQQNRRKKAFLNPCHSVSVCETCGGIQHVWLCRLFLNFQGLWFTFVCVCTSLCVCVCVFAVPCPWWVVGILVEEAY